MATLEASQWRDRRGHIVFSYQTSGAAYFSTISFLEDFNSSAAHMRGGVHGSISSLIWSNHQLWNRSVIDPLVSDDVGRGVPRKFLHPPNAFDGVLWPWKLWWVSSCVTVPLHLKGFVSKRQKESSQGRATSRPKGEWELRQATEQVCGVRNWSPKEKKLLFGLFFTGTVENLIFKTSQWLSSSLTFVDLVLPQFIVIWRGIPSSSRHTRDVVCGVD